VEDPVLFLKLLGAGERRRQIGLPQDLGDVHHEVDWWW
jgi:hypothetical protein